MPDRQQKNAYMTLVDYQIGELEEKIDKQIELIEQLAATGQSTEQASKVFVLLLDTLDAIQQHRSAVLKALDKKRG